MICKRCQIAGDLVAEARSMDRTVPIQIITNTRTTISIEGAVRSVAHLYHGLCKGSTHCDCQHKVDFEGKVIKNGVSSGNEVR